MSPKTYDMRLVYGLIQMLVELDKAKELPKPMHELRVRYANRIGMSERELHPFEREAWKGRFRTAMNNMEDTIIRSEHTVSANKTPVRLIHFLKPL